jgi:hypothetical protein
MILATKFSIAMVSDDVRCRCDGVAMLKATSEIRRIVVAPEYKPTFISLRETLLKNSVLPMNY